MKKALKTIWEKIFPPIASLTAEEMKSYTQYGRRPDSIEVSVAESLKKINELLDISKRYSREKPTRETHILYEFPLYENPTEVLARITENLEARGFQVLEFKDPSYHGNPIIIIQWL